MKKGNRRKAANADGNTFLRDIDDEKLKKNRKKFMSFSKRKQQHYQQRQYLKKQSQYQNGAGAASAVVAAAAASSNSTASISSSYSSHSLKSPHVPPSSPPASAASGGQPALDMTVQSGMIPTSPSSLFSGGDYLANESAKSSPASIFNMLSSNTQRLFSFQSPSSPTTTTAQSSSAAAATNNPATRMPTSLESDSDLYNKLGNDDDIAIGTGTRKHQLKLDLNDDGDLQQSDFIVGANRPPSNLESPVGTVSDLIKTKVFFKLNHIGF